MYKIKAFQVNCKQTFFRNAIKDDGGIPGFEALADEIVMLSDLRESWASFKASNVSFAADETYISKHF